MYSKISDSGFWDAVAAEPGQEITRAQGMQTAVFPLGDPGDSSAVRVIALKVPPFGIVVRHSHDCERFEIVVEGSMHIGDGVVLGVGDCLRSRAGDMYGPHMAGPEGCVTYEIFSSQAGGARMVYETENGPVATHVGPDYRRPEGIEAYARRLLGPWPGPNSA